MPHKLLSIALTTAFALTLFTHAAWSQEQVIYSFSDPGGDVGPHAGLISDAAGNLYGTTIASGADGVGTVYELTKTAAGWNQTVLYSFKDDGKDGFFATGGLVFDPEGNLYGTTQFGGTGNCSVGFGCGTVFKLSPNGHGSWTETVLHDFTGADGWQIFAGLVRDSAGNLYGTALNGGKYSRGTVYKLSPAVNGSWNLTVLHHFTGGIEGGFPYGGVILDAAGNLYGTASQGGGTTAACRFGCGTVFELSPASDGHWTGHLLHNFNATATDGNYPAATLTSDAGGNLYGTAAGGGGALNHGIVFELTHGSGKWVEKVLHNFNTSSTDGRAPSASLVFDAAGNLYSVTGDGGAYGHGTVFELSPAASGWTETVLHNFNDDGSDGVTPGSALMFDAAGNLYGTTGLGGSFNEGTIFEVTP